MFAYVETGVNRATIGGVAAWSFDLAHWGVAGQGRTEAAAVAELERLTGQPVDDVVERIDGDERAFDRDRMPATAAERAITMAILAAARSETLALFDAATDEQLDREDPHRHPNNSARGQTPRQVFQHIADTESRDYLPALGLARREPTEDLRTELAASAVHVRAELLALPDHPLSNISGGEEWTTVKLLRRLAWHERGQLVTIRQLLQGARPSAGR
ncbi:MAG: hypothetical protein JWR53_1898 [Glaciihabitans sp.]|nr:hypothetical protein [Glaciihabitans sp.]